MKIGLYGILFCFGAVLAASQTTSSPAAFKHIVIIFQENRTPDNLFYNLCSPPYGTAASCSATSGKGQYNIQTSNWADKTNLPSKVIQPLPVPLDNTYDLSHAHAAFTAMCDFSSGDSCKMDGASGIPCSGTCLSQPQFRYVDNSAGQVNPYLDLATQYGWANYMFQTNQGPSFPAHQFIFGGTSAPSAADDAIGTFASENMSDSGVAGTAKTAGCIAPLGTLVQLIDSSGVELKGNEIYPCFEHKTLADILPAGTSWRYYAPSDGSIWTAPNAISHICDSSGYGGECVGKEWKNNVDLNPPDIFGDISNCTLRSVSWVIPKGQYSDHAKGNLGEGPSWVGDIVDAIGSSSKCDNGAGYWQDTAILITWDDWGGWYDHEAPSILPYPQGGYQLGFRVPFVAVSAYTPSGYINDVPHDFGDILRFIEKNFGLTQGALNFADNRGPKNDLGLFFDLSAKPRTFKTIKTALPASYFIDDKRPAEDPDDQ